MFTKRRSYNYKDKVAVLLNIHIEYPLDLGREGTLHNKLLRYPKYYKHLPSFVSCKCLGTFIKY